jgi:heavy metal sensor kinase
MRSIRLSLIMYFLVLLTLALGGVAWFVNETTARTLQGRQASTRALIESQYQYQCREIRTALDLRILRQAQALARKARFRDHLEQLYPIGLMATPLQLQGYLNVPLWLATARRLTPPEGGPKGRAELEARQAPAMRLSQSLYRMHEIVIEDADEIVPPPNPLQHQAQEYFQTYNDFRQTQQYSEKLEHGALTLDEGMARAAVFLKEEFDNVQPKAGWKLRRVTIKDRVTRGPRSSLPFWLRFAPFPPFGKNTGRQKGPPLEQLLGPPVVFVQYASDTSMMDQQLRGFGAERDAKIAQLETETHDALAALRWRLLWICSGTFAGFVAGGLVLVGLGLAPLARLSDAVSKVSEKDFRLKINSANLPRELQPIAARLSDTLDQLKRAFAREKQAAADISHELRTPLAAMMTTLELAVRKSRTAAEYREMLEDIRSSGTQMSHLVERLLALARLDAGAVQVRIQDIDARDVARQCTNLIRPLAEARGLELRLHAPESVRLKVDPDKLREILNNLLHNAVEYNRPQGTVDLNVSRVNGHVQLAVHDTGIGIKPEQREHIFERFFRADPSRHADSPHAGLGLAIVKSYVDLMGGTIGVDSGDKGSTFTVELPVN